MAVKSSTPAAAKNDAAQAATPAGAPAQPQMPPMSGTPGGVTRACAIRDMNAGLPQPNSLSTEGKDYLAKLTDLLAVWGIKTKASTVSGLEVRVLTTEDEQFGFILGMAETYQPFEGLPVTEKLAQVVQFELASVFPKGMHKIQSVVVAKADYPLVEQMSAHIVRCLKVVSEPNAYGIDVNTLSAEDLTISLDQQAVNAFIGQYAPQATLARNDIGCLVSLRRRTNRFNVLTNREEIETTPIMAFSAYSKFFVNNNTFLAVPTISDIVATVPSKALVAMAYPIAADALISRLAWQRPYATFAKDKPNLGNMLPGNDGKMWAYSNAAEMQEFINKYIAPPFLAIEITEGRARIPGIDAILCNNGIPAAKDISNFLGVDVSAIPMVINTTVEYTGTVKTSEGLVDSRKIDYLYLAAKGVKDMGAISTMLFPTNDPRARLQQIGEHITAADITPLYTTYTCFLNAAFVVQVGSIIGASARLQYDATMKQMDYNIQQLLSSTGANVFTGGLAVTNRGNGLGLGSTIQYSL
jgi:hypothetical protein